MVLEEWGRVWSLYKQVNKQVSKALRFPRPVWSYRLLWAGNLSFWVFFPLPLIGVAVAIESKWSDVTNILIMSTPIVFLVLLGQFRMFAIAKDSAKLFPVEYQTYGLAQYPFREQLNHLRYALFVDTLRNRRYSHAGVAKLRSFGEIARSPEMPTFRLSQHPVFIYLMGFFTPLAINFITTSPSWKSGRVAPVIIGTVLQFVSVTFVVLFGWHIVMNQTKYTYLEIQHFLQLAELDIKEKPPVMLQRLHEDLSVSHTRSDAPVNGHHCT